MKVGDKHKIKINGKDVEVTCTWIGESIMLPGSMKKAPHSNANVMDDN